MRKLKAFKIFVVFFLLILFFYNLLIALESKYEADGDAWDYVHLGLCIAKNGSFGFSSNNKDQILNDFREDIVNEKDYELRSKTAFRPPVWPFLIAGVFLIFGYSLAYIIIFKFLLHVIGIFIFYKILKLLKLQELIIIIGTFLYGISPAWQLYSRVFLSEPITLFFITLWLYLLINFIRGKFNFLPQAVISGILILSHPYFIFLPFSIWLILYLKKEMKIKTLFISALICASIVSLWILRNMAVFNTNVIVLTTSSGAVMAKGWNPVVPNEHTNTKGDLADEELVLLGYEYESDKYYSELERMQLYKNATINFIRSNPDVIFPITNTKLLSAFNPFPETPKPGILETGRWFFQFLALLSLFYILIFTRNRLLHSLAIGLILSTIAITILTYSGFRFRMPQVGLEVVFIAYVINDILLRRRRLNIGSGTSKK